MGYLRPGQSRPVGAVPASNRLPKMCRCEIEVTLQIRQFLLGGLDLLLSGAHILQLALLLITRGLLQAFLGKLQQAVSGVAQTDGT